MKTEFFMPMIPPTKTHQGKQVRVLNGKPVFYEPAELKAARAKLQGHLSKHVPTDKYTKALRLMVKWCFPVVGDYKSGQYKITKPDTDNLNKLFMDCCTECGFWKDDSQVVSLVVEKFYSKIPGIYVRIEEL